MRKHENDHKIDNYGKYITTNTEVDIMNLMDNQNEIIEWIESKKHLFDGKILIPSIENGEEEKDLTKEEVIKKCVEIAIENGWSIDDNPMKNATVKLKNNKIFIDWFNDYMTDDEEYYNWSWQLEELIFDHNFDRYLFKQSASFILATETIQQGNSFKTKEYKDEIAWRIRELASSEDRISYLRNWLKENNL